MNSNDPSAATLQAADMIALYDPDVPGWSEVVVGSWLEALQGLDGFVSIEVPVNSKDPAALQRWRERILRLWQSESE